MSEAIATIKQLKDKDGKLISPYTHVRAVYDDNGQRLDQNLGRIDSLSAETKTTLNQYKIDATNEMNAYKETTDQKIRENDEAVNLRITNFSASTTTTINNFSASTTNTINTFSAETTTKLNTFSAETVTNFNNFRNETNPRLDELEFVTYPLTVDGLVQNGGTWEIGDTKTPNVSFNITRHKVGIANRADVIINITPTPASKGVKPGTDNKTYQFTGNPVSAGTTTYNMSVSQSFNGDTQTKSPGTATYTFINYRYYGEVSSVPSDYPAAIKALAGKQLSTNTTLSNQKLTANKYYLFAVKGNVNFFCYIAGSTTLINGCVTGTCTVQQENYATSKLTNTYSYILVPKSEIAWTFDITNSKK